MFQLHDTTRRRLCVAGFLLFGVLPTLWVSAWCISRRLPGHAMAEAQELGRQLGLDVKLGGVEHRSPGSVVYNALELADPDTGQTILRCRLLEVAQQQQVDPQEQPRVALVLTASQPEVEAVSLDRIRQCVERMLARTAVGLEADVKLSAADLTLQSPTHSQTLTDVHGTIENRPERTCAELTFRLPDADAPEPARICVFRNRQVSPLAGGFELDTGGGEVPCDVLAWGLDDLKPLGPRCHFRGRIGANESPDGWQGTVIGRLTGLDLGGLVSDHFPHKLTGAAEVTVLSSRFARGRLEEGSALIVAEHGVIGRSLLSAAVERLGLVSASTPLPTEEIVPYQQLAFSATLDAHGLELRGRCDNAGTILCDVGGRPLLGESLQQPTPPMALVRALAPQSLVEIPDGRQAKWLLDHLRQSAAIPDPDSVPANARLKVRDPIRR